MRSGHGRWYITLYKNEGMSEYFSQSNENYLICA